jgi:hypothetical protein
VRQLAYGIATDTIDENLKLGKTNVLECQEYYCAGIIEYFRPKFLRHPTVAETQRLLAKTEERDFFWYVREHRLYVLAWHNCLIGW